MPKPRCPVNDCEADAEQVDVDFDRYHEGPDEVQETIVCEDGHQVTVSYDNPVVEEVHLL